MNYELLKTLKILIVEDEKRLAQLLKEAIADYVETQSRMFYVFSDSNADTYTVATTDIFSKLKAKGYDRSFGIYTKDGVGNAMIEAAWVGRFSAEPIGSAIWIYKD